MATPSVFTQVLDPNSSPCAGTVVTVQLGHLASALRAFDGCLTLRRVATPCHPSHSLAAGSKVPSMILFTGKQMVVCLCTHAIH